LKLLKDNDVIRLTFNRSKHVNDNILEFEFGVVCQALCTNTSVTHLLISNVAFTTNSMQALVEMLLFNTSIESLILSHTLFDADQMAALASGLQGNSTLQELALENTTFQQHNNATTVDDLLIHALNPNITSLGLSSNQIDSKCAETIADCLKTNTTLKTLELWDNQIGDDGALSIWQAMALNSTLEVLSVKKNGISEVLERKLMRQVQSNRSKQEQVQVQHLPPKKSNKKQSGVHTNNSLLEKRVASLEQAHKEQVKCIADLQTKLLNQSELFEKLGNVFSPGVSTTATAPKKRKKRKT